MKKIIFLLELGLFLMSINLFSQAYLINTNYCIVSNHTYLIVNGHLNNQSSGNLYLTGTNSNVIIQNNITNNGTINSYGIIDLYGDWINNSTYTHNNTSYVYLKGANQNIGGSTTTTFYNLYLQGTGVKTLGNNQNVDGTLNLNDRELATQNYTMTINNTTAGAIQRTTGFVSSTVGGGLARATNSTSTYLYPVGSSGKYRPADITPSSTTASIYKVRMANVDASSEGYNRNNKASDICEVNPSFFHIMQQTSGTSNNANIKVYYDNTIDGSWDKVGNWNGSLWNNYTGSSTSSGSPLYYGIANNVSLSSSTPIALTKNAPVLTASASPSSICSGSSTTLSASGASTYSWTDGTNNYTGNSINVSPTSNTTYTVTGTIGTCSATATVSVTVNPSPSLTVNATPSLICQGNNATLSASGASTYSWTDGTNNYSGNSITVTPTVNTTYTVTGTNGTCSATAAVTVTVNPAPTLTVNATDNQLCTGESATLTANGANTYNWSHSLGSGSSKTVSPTSTTTYTVTGTTAEGCSNTASISITVNPVPNVSANASPNTICIGGSSTLSASGANTYLWSNGSSGASITVSPNSTTTYTVIGASTAGCTNTATITVYVSTTINITANANPSSICEGAYSILSASGADTYNWSNSMNLSTITVTPTNTTSYTVTGYSGGCTGTATVSVTVNPLPTMIASANPSSICYNEVTTLTASGANNYSWSHSLGTGSNVTVTPTTNTTYTVTGTNIYNCSNTASVSVVVNPIPTVNITASSTTICQGDQTILTATGADSYSWYHGLGTNNIITVSPSSTTTYTVVGTNTAGCSATASIAITVNPNADATINPIDPLCDNQEQITLTAHTSGGLWSGTGITNQVLGTFSPAIAGTGTHAITYMISGMCGDTATTEISIYDSPDATAYATDETCIDANDGIAWVEVTGGTPPYAFLWSTYHTLDSIANLAPGEYYVTANDFHNCSDKDTVLIKPGTEDCYITHIYVPNIFSPDDKGNPENEYLRVYGKGIKSIDFKIFDRWGNEVFHTTDINLGWDGTYKGEPALTGDYTYILKVSYTKKPDDIIKGHIYLIR
ncbi:MAG TPA: gliding motility-associated C-terminal domain-containing protein [Bacteroidales bacterium]|nr:gliding motility-associated C-terminal domain-containing protein [Bacteroidales bacterium]